MNQVNSVLLVENINISRNFYTKILKLGIVDEWNGKITLDNQLLLQQIDMIEPQAIMEKYLKPGKQGKNNAIVYMELKNNNIYEFMDYLISKTVKVLHGVEEVNGQRILRVFDPDNHIIEIATPVSD